MILATAFLGTAGGGAYHAAGNFSWWQTFGGLVVVFGLLLISLKLLSKLNRRSLGAESSLLNVWHLGPKKEIQILRLGDKVHYIYRHDGAMVVLQSEPHADYERKCGQQGQEPQPAGWRDGLSGRLSFWKRASLRTPDARTARTHQAQG
jgi:hypothetical protein